MNDYTANVEAGAALLDQFGPSKWWLAIDAESLDMNDFTKCVIGQVFGIVQMDNRFIGDDFDAICKSVLHIGSQGNGDRIEAADFGFDVEHRGFSTEKAEAELKTAWLSELDRRGF